MTTSQDGMIGTYGENVILSPDELENRAALYQKLNGIKSDYFRKLDANRIIQQL